MKKEISWPVWLEMNEPQEVSSVQEENTLSEFDTLAYNESINFFQANDLAEFNAILNTSLNTEQVLKLINDTIDTGSCSLADVECIADVKPTIEVDYPIFPAWIRFNKKAEIISIEPEALLTTKQVDAYWNSVGLEFNRVNNATMLSKYIDLTPEQLLMAVKDTAVFGSCDIHSIIAIDTKAHLQPNFIKVVKYDATTVNKELAGKRFDSILTMIKDGMAFHYFMRALVIISQVWDEEVTKLVYDNNYKIAWYSGDTLHELIWNEDEIKLVK